MKKIKVERLGQGMGAGEKVEVLKRKDILEIIENLSDYEIIKTAYEGFNKRFKTGYATINLETGELQTVSLGQGETHQAIDNTFVIIYTFDMNADLSDICENYEDETELIETIEFNFELDWTLINMQLNEWYK